MSIFNHQTLTPRTQNQNQNPFAVWQKEMSSLLDRFGRDIGNDFGFGTEGVIPKVEVKEKDKKYIVRAEIPGMKESDISVTLRDNNLILEGERKVETEKEEEGTYRSEFTYGSFYRAIPLDEDVNANTVKAAYRDGILTVDLEKLETTTHKTKKIPIMKS
jgi:HSP20 family protein